VAHKGEVGSHCHTPMTRSEHGNIFSTRLSGIIHDILMLPLFSKIRNLRKKQGKVTKVEDCRIGAPAVFAALKRTYGKKERIFALTAND
jgi:hypothetical protein